MSVRWYKVIPTLVALSLAFTLALVLIDDYDVWWHLKCGEMLLRHGTIPRNEIFSYTAAGRPWVDGYLPAQALLYLSWWIAGAAGVCVLGALLVTASYAVALAICRRQAAGFGVALAISLPAIFLARAVMLPRPALLSPIFALLILWLLEDHRLKGGRRLYWILPLTALWANCHPGFPLGLFITFIYIAGSIRNAPMRNRLIFLLGLQLIATLINPYGYRIYYSAFSFLANSQMKDVIIEWKPLYGEPHEPPGVIPCFVAMTAIWAACVIWKGRRNRIEHALLFISLALSTAYGRRNLILFGPMSIPLIAWTVGDAAAGESRLWRNYAALQRLKIREIMVKVGAILIIAVGLFLTWAAATNRLYTYASSFRATGIGVQEAMFPEKVVEMMKNEHIEGNIFHIYGLGGYMIFKLYPKYRVLIDGRMYPYPYDLFVQEETALHSEEVFEGIRLRYDIRGVLLPLYPQNTWATIYAFIRSPNWATVAADGSGVLFLGRGVGNDEIIRRYEMDLLKEPPQLETRASPKQIHWWSRAEYPYGSIRWAKFYEQIGRVDLAAKALRPGLNFRPMIKNLDAWLGGLLIQAGNLDEGYALVEQVLKREPDNIAALSGWADYLIAKSEYDEAEKILLQMLRLQPDLAKVWDTLGEISYNRRDFTIAARRFQKAVMFDPNEIRYWERWGVALQTYDVPGAIDAYQHALEIGRKGGSLPEDVKRIREHLEALQK